MFYEIYCGTTSSQVLLTSHVRYNAEHVRLLLEWVYDMSRQVFGRQVWHTDGAMCTTDLVEQSHCHP